MKLTAQDLAQLKAKGISEQQLEEQLNNFRTGFPALKISAAASIGNGIISIPADKQADYLDKWDKYLATGKRILKFVPASGAASRMFKDLFEYLDSGVESKFIEVFFAHLHYFAFYPTLDATCQRLHGKSADELVKANRKQDVVAALLNKEGMNYGNLPKGLLLFHKYDNEVRTPAMEHLVEGALYAASNANVNLHFTISHEHHKFFEEHIDAHIKEYAERYGVKFNVGFSEQKPSTDTVAATKDNEPFRNDDGSLLFRPGGHGALIENLSEVDADIVFVKNIDNVVPDRMKDTTVRYKKLIAGLLVQLQEQTFAYLHELDNSDISDAKLSVIERFAEERLCIGLKDAMQGLDREHRRQLLHTKLNRPMRVCGMVKNEGEPGGGPFLVIGEDKTTTPQILESSQIEDKSIMARSTHFNPVDLVCGIRNYNGEKFDLKQYVDKKTGFISEKSKNGKELKALELPGLWNGAMADWTTLFVEVPAETFNPVKTVNDLLRPQHQ